MLLLPAQGLSGLLHKEPWKNTAPAGAPPESLTIDLDAAIRTSPLFQPSPFARPGPGSDATSAAGPAGAGPGSGAAGGASPGPNGAAGSGVEQQDFGRWVGRGNPFKQWGIMGRAGGGGGSARKAKVGYCWGGNWSGSIWETGGGGDERTEVRMAPGPQAGDPFQS